MDLCKLRHEHSSSDRCMKKVLSCVKCPLDFHSLMHFNSLIHLSLLLALNRLVICQHQYEEYCDNIDTHFIRNMTSEESGYYKWIKPNEGKVKITVSMQINRYAFYKDVESLFQIQVWFDFEWIDPRLQFACNESLKIEGNNFHYAKIWSPNLRISRNKDVDVLNSPSLSQLIFVRIDHQGKVQTRIRSNLNQICPMDYRNYPFDSQMCKISLISNNLPVEKLELNWDSNDEVKIDNHLYMSGHLVEGLQALTENETIKGEQFSMLTVELSLMRQTGHYMLVYFLPSMLIVATSWLSFWVEITSTPSRITLSVTTSLALVTISKEIGRELPKVPYIKATDLWFAGCIVSIFMTLIEYIFVAYTYREEKKKYKDRKKFKRSLSATSLTSLETQTTISKLDTSTLHLTPMESDRFGRRYSANCLPMRSSLPTQHPRIQFTFSPPDSPDNATEMDLNQLFKDTPQEVAQAIDRKCRILFPLGFALFNLIYWSYL